MESYVEHAPLPALAGVLRTVWIHTTGEQPYVQRHLPTGGVEVHAPIGGEPRILGPLTGPQLEVIPPHTTVVGVRFKPGAALPGLADLVDQHAGLVDLWGSSGHRLAEVVALAGTPTDALVALQRHLMRSPAGRADRIVTEAVQLLMPWHPVDVADIATHLGLSPSQLRRRCVQATGMGPKALQRTLRFQGFLALAQAGASATGRRGADGVAGLAIDVGYADQAHLSRECRRLTGVSPRQLLGSDVDRCACGHDHAASYRPFLATRGRARLRT